MRFRLGTLLILLAVLPPVLATLWLSPTRPLAVSACCGVFLFGLLGWRAMERLCAT